MTRDDADQMILTADDYAECAAYHDACDAVADAFNEIAIADGQRDGAIDATPNFANFATMEDAAEGTYQAHTRDTLAERNRYTVGYLLARRGIKLG